MNTLKHAIILTWLLSFWSGFAFGQSPFNAELPMVCGNTDNILAGLRERFNEEIVMMAPSENNMGDELYHSLWINAGTSSWSFIVVNKQRNVTCVIASGQNVSMFFPGDRT